MPQGRPLKARTPPPDREISVYLLHYLEKQNEVAESLRSYQQMANGLLTIASQQIGTLSQALSGLQQSTRNVLDANGIDPADDKLESFAALAPILKMDKTELANSLSLASTDLAALALKQQKKQKKPRKPRDPNAPQRPHTAFFLFQAANREKFRDEMRQRDPDVKPGQVQSRLTEVWNGMTPEEQKPYKDKYQEQNEAYNKAKAEYETQHGKSIEDPSMPIAQEDGNTVAALINTSMPVEDASGDADSSDEDDSKESSEEPESSSAASPTPPPPKKSKDKKDKKAKPVVEKIEPVSPEKKKKRKHERAETSEDAGSKRKKAAEEVERSAKKDKKRNHDSNIDPELSRLDKQQRKEKKDKHLEGYAPAQQSAPGFPMHPPAGYPPQGFPQQGFPPMTVNQQHYGYNYQRGGM